MTTAAEQFLRKAVAKSSDLAHRQLIRRSIDHYERAVARGRARFMDWQAARQRAHEIRWEAINHLDRYLLQFEEKVKERGGHVFWAENGEEARRYITDVAARNNVRRVVKSKSMVAEEIGLSPTLEKNGIEVFETDLGEFIVQLRHEPPYHIITPAMHLSRTDIAALFRDKLKFVHASDNPTIETDDPPKLVAAARHALRSAFFSAEMGITGANFLVADAGMVALTTNEGNADLGMILPRIHVVLTGIEKVIPHLDDLALLWPLLAGSGTGQPITCYNSLIAGARNAGETGGPDEFHVVLLDNGRSELLADPEQREVLHCIRCGACLNACPVFRTVGGHTYGTAYPGPIGSVLTPHLRGSEFQHLSYASSLCGACTEVCPVQIELHRHLLQNRRNAVDPSERPDGRKEAGLAERDSAERVGFKLWQWMMMGPKRFAAVGLIGRGLLSLLYLLGLENTPFDPLRAWTRNHAAPRIPAKSFRALWREHAAD
jgi:L-lactate dehydrogenase complex protein LldF